MRAFTGHPTSPSRSVGPLSGGRELRALCREYLRRDAWLVDPEHLARRIRVEELAPWRARISGTLGEFAELAERALFDLLSQQYEEERTGFPVPQSDDALFYRRFALAAGVELTRARQACVALNTRSVEVRRAFFALVLEERRLATFAASDADALATAAHLAAWARVCRVGAPAHNGR